MIANFYKITNDMKTKILLTSKNIECVPHRGDPVLFQGQYFRVFKVVLDIEICEYNIYLSRL